ncbi:Protein O-mannosyl-transferase 1 [Mactra antiquata]
MEEDRVVEENPPTNTEEASPTNTEEASPTNTNDDDEKKSSGNNEKNDPFTVNIQLDVMQIGLFIVALATRTWRLSFPNAVVFDELHFTNFASLYLKRIFFFDIHPPLGKLILAFAGHFVGFKGEMNVTHVGAEYPSDFPVIEFRLLPAICGSLIVPIVYQIAVELGLNKWSALLAAGFILLDNALLVQSRFILLEGMLLMLMSLSVLSYLKFRKLSHRSYSLKWWFWLSLTAVSFSCALSIKYIGTFTGMFIFYLIIKDYWRMLADYTLSDFSLVKHFLVRSILLLGIPVLVYVYAYYIHLSLLTKAGPHDNVLSSAFQASLEGGLASLTKGQPLYVSYGSQITLRQTYREEPCWLHSHEHVYPIRYEDGRGSSHQQQVTCYTFKDINNWWIIKDPNGPSMNVDDPPEPVKNGDIIQIVHGITGRALNSHDVASAVTPTNQEVSCYINYNISMRAQNLWKVEIISPDSRTEQWETIHSQVRLIHVNSSQALKITGQTLPEWGFNQLEVVTDKILHQESAIWNVEEHKYTYAEKAEDRLRELQLSEMLPTEPTYLSFWEKFFELHLKLIYARQTQLFEHKFSSSPIDWPWMTKTVAYWISNKSHSQIHLVGNLVVWISGAVSILLYIGLLGFYLLRRRREFYDLTQDEWKKFLFIFDVIVVGYMFHYLPYFLADKVLFLHNYLPCVIFKALSVAAVVEHCCHWISRSHYGKYAIQNIIVILLSAAVWMFIELSALSYGHGELTPKDVDKLQKMESWDLLYHG